MDDTGKTSGFFAVDRRTWARVCGLGLNRAVAYLVLTCGTGKSNRESAWSVTAIEKYTGVSRSRAHDAVSALVKDGVVRKLREGTRPKYELVPWHLVPGNDTRPLTDTEESVIKKVILCKEIPVSQRGASNVCLISVGSSMTAMVDIASRRLPIPTRIVSGYPIPW